MNYNDLKNLDEESLQKLKEGSGPADECICNLLAPSDDRKSLGASIKKAFSYMKPKKKKGNNNMSALGQNSVELPLTFTKGEKGIYTTKEAVKRSSKCGKCACDNENIVLKHSYANIRIVSPDISSICPCPTDCLPDKEKLRNNIKITVEQLQLDVDDVDSEFSLYDPIERHAISEPLLHLDKRSITSLINAQYDDDLSDWSSDEDEGT